VLSVDDAETVRELAELADAYEAALMANDVGRLDAMFWNAPQAVRYGVGENLYGFDEIAAFRKGRVGGSPQRRRLRTHITALGRDVGVVNVEFQREGGSRIGRQSQTWVRTDEGWRIAAAHVSLMADVC
jgi:hypothetical protein